MGVYFLQAGRLTKIGWTEDLETRTATLQNDSPTRMKLLYHIEVAPRDLEFEYHRRLAQYRRHGEWFDTDAVLALLESEGVAVNRASHDRRLRLPKILSTADILDVLETLTTRFDAETGGWGDKKRHSYRVPRDYLALELMYLAGLRVSEAVSVRPHQFDFDAGTITILESKGGQGTAYFNAGLLREPYDAWMAARSKFKRLASETPLICHPNGGHVSTRYYQRLLSDARRELGWPVSKRCTPHVLRHTFATQRLAEGFSVPEVQRLLRHRRQETTATYLWVKDDDLREKMRGATTFLAGPHDRRIGGDTPQVTEHPRAPRADETIRASFTILELEELMRGLILEARARDVEVAG